MILNDSCRSFLATHNHTRACPTLRPHQQPVLGCLQANKILNGVAFFAPHNHTRACALYLTAVGFEPTQLALVQLESTPLDHSGKLSLGVCKLKRKEKNINQR